MVLAEGLVIYLTPNIGCESRPIGRFANKISLIYKKIDFIGLAAPSLSYWRVIANLRLYFLGWGSRLGRPGRF